MKYTVLIEKGPTSYGAYAPDLPGCGAVADTRDEVTQLIREAIDLHLEGLRRDGDPVPQPQTTAIEVHVPTADQARMPTAV
ncbi:MAG: type II toxin-antitoxin system HicB family antitoxin [Acidobacteria bacterium]|nr:type II toxin-antitoxin system HicB family antitoxin [Acidobacteriota bacterium]